MKKWEYLKWTNEDLEAVLSVFGKDINTYQDDVRAIKDWASKLPHLQKYLKQINLDDIIGMILIFNKFRIEVAKSKIDMYFYRMNNKCLEDSFKSVYVVTLPTLTKDYGRIYISCLNETYANLYKADDYIIRILKMAEIRLQYDICLYDYYIVDCRWVTMHLVTQYDFVTCKKLLTIVEKMFSMRCKAVYFINASKIIDNMIAFFKPITKKKLFDRIHASTNADILFELLPESEVPSDFGGHGMSLKELSEIWRKKYEEIDDRLDFLKDNPVDESLRPGKQLNDEYFGVDGHFRKLNVD